MCFKSKRIQELDAYLSQIRSEALTEEIRLAFVRQLEDWSEAGVREARGYTEKEWNWAGLFLLDAARERAIFFLAWERNGTQHLDMFTGEAQKPGWQFYRAGLPGFTLKGYTPEQALASVKEHLIQDGLVSWRGRIRQSYLVQRWFLEERARLHAAWLADRIVE